MEQEKEPTNRELMQAILAVKSELFERIDGVQALTLESIEAMHVYSQSVDKRFDSVDARFGAMDARFDTIDAELREIKSTMATKDYVDKKIAEMRGDNVLLMRKEDTKLKTFAGMVTEHGGITVQQQQQLLDMDPFPQIKVS